MTKLKIFLFVCLFVFEASIFVGPFETMMIPVLGFAQQLFSLEMFLLLFTKETALTSTQ